MALTVTATASGSGIQNGFQLAVRVLNNASLTQNGATVTSATATQPEVAITPGTAGSWVYGAVVVNSGTAISTLATGTTSVGTGAIASGGPQAGVYRSTSGTTTSSTTYGWTTPTVASGSVWISCAEIKASGTLAEDASTPAVVTTTTATTATSASFTPPGSSVLVACVNANWTGSAGFTVAVTDSASQYNWTQLVHTVTESITSIWVGIPKGTTAPAGLASATAAAQVPTAHISVTGTAGLAAGTAAAQVPTAHISVTGMAGLAAATAAAYTPTAGTVATAGLATATAAALTPAVHISVTGTAGLATATAAAKTPTAVVGPVGGLAHGVAAALTPVVHASASPTAGLAQANAIAYDARGVVLRNPLNLGAVLDVVTPSGSVTPETPSATFTVPDYGATLALADFGATLTGWTMLTAPLSLSEFNDETINLAITQNGAAYNLTGVTVNLLMKTVAGTPDANALTFSSGGGSPAITITNASGGLATAVIPHTDLEAETYAFYRVDVVSGGLTNTCVYGPIAWITL